MNVFSKPRLAIIGGGQLGMMLCEAARPLGIETLIVSADKSAPALAFADQIIVKDYASEGLAGQIARAADVVTFEFEAVAAELLTELQRLQIAGKIQVHPDPAMLRLLQNKALQKQWLKEHGLPTLPFVATRRPHEDVDAIVEQIGLPFVQKAQQGGYDGYGVQVINSRSDLEKLWDKPSMIERYVKDPVELGVVLARSAKEQVVAYPPVRMDFKSEQNILDAVVYPTGFSAEINAAAEALARQVVNDLQGVGVFAVEIFLLDNEELVVNEISPRVHNSGHHTIECFDVSQFEQHVRAVCGLQLREPAPLHEAAVMRNLLYSDELEFMLKYPSGVTTSHDMDVFVHWYGKTDPRPGRKMGHVTCLCDSPADAGQRIEVLLDFLSQPHNGAIA